MTASNTRSERRGAVLVIVLVCLTVAMTLVVGWAQVAALEVRQNRAALDRAQAAWLAESALDRAAARLFADPDYQGETWQIAADELGRAAGSPQAGGVAVIAVDRVAGDDQARQVRVRADYPASGARTTRVSKQLKIDLALRGDNP